MTVQKENLEKLLAFINEIADLPENAWFKEKLQGEVRVSNAGVSNATLDEIYEYCIKQIVKSHAENFYKDFKLIDIKPKLIQDFIRMENFRRADNFEDFCLAAFQQVECVVMRLSSEESFRSYISQHGESHSLLRYDVSLQKLVPFGQSLYQLISRSKGDRLEQFKITEIKDWFFIQIFRGILFYYYFNREVKSNTDQFEKLAEAGNYLYQARNLNHRGQIQNGYQKEILDKIIPHQHKYYFKFLGVLEDLISTINRNLVHSVN